MKHLILILSIILGSAMMYAQPNDTLDNIAKSINKACPKPAGDGLTLNQVVASDSTFTFFYNIADDMFKNVQRLGGILHDSTLDEMMSSPNPDTQQLLALCKNNKIKIIINFLNSEGKSIDITILPEEL